MQSSSSDRQRKGRNSFAEIEIVRSSKDGSAIMQVKERSEPDPRDVVSERRPFRIPGLPLETLRVGRSPFGSCLVYLRNLGWLALC